MRMILIAAMLILSGCHMIVKPPAVTVAPGIAPPTVSLLPTITPDLRTVTP